MKAIVCNDFGPIKNIKYMDVEDGEFEYRWIDTEKALIHTEILKPGDVVRQRPGQPHQLESLTYGRIFEVSTYHEDSDSYRVLPGDSQR